MTDYKLIGKRLADRRRALGLRQCELAERAGLSDKYISNIERSYSIPSIEVIMKLCEALETTPDHILIGTSNPDSNLRCRISEKLPLVSESHLPLLEKIIDAFIYSCG